ncbi:hypothetical protein E2C01_037587 [Portunus trituberculatus]|uniref:Uncharacterized protein n=1 Tax=Portunus trituberculatus TaxID=210409 RepID=A0A5B7FFB9_PORTR|nr:hypothetical protein [Portunus trituberculatus]
MDRYWCIKKSPEEVLVPFPTGGRAFSLSRRELVPRREGPPRILLVVRRRDNNSGSAQPTQVPATLAYRQRTAAAQPPASRGGQGECELSGREEEGGSG